MLWRRQKSQWPRKRWIPPPIAGCIFPRLQSAIMIIRARAANSSTLIQSIQSMLIAPTDNPLLFSFLSFIFLFLTQTVRSTRLSVLYKSKTVPLHHVWCTLSYLTERYVYLILDEISRRWCLEEERNFETKRLVGAKQRSRGKISSKTEW